MGRHLADRSLFTVLLLTAPMACGTAPPPNARDLADANDTGRALGAQTANERAILAHAAALRNGIAERVGEATITAEASYEAASGHTCRALHISVPTSPVTNHRLVCHDGGAWFFVPDVFGTQTNSNPE